jgi:hypothetical protein
VSPDIKQIAADFGSAESCLRNCLRQADVEDGLKPGTTAAENAELREVKRADPAAGAGQWGPAPCCGLPVVSEPAGKMSYPLVREPTADGIPAAVTCDPPPAQ